jgi:hypothetical protein
MWFNYCELCRAVMRRASEVLGNHVARQQPHRDLKERLKRFQELASQGLPLLPDRRQRREQER